MNIPNRFSWAEQVIVDGTSGQQNRTALEQRYLDYGIKDFAEKPLRQKFNQALYQVGENMAFVEGQLTSIDALAERHNPFYSIYRTPLTNPDFIIERMARMSGAQTVQNDGPGTRLRLNIFDNSSGKIHVNDTWADTPSADPMPANTTGDPLVNGEDYVLVLLYNSTTDKTSYCVVENYNYSYSIPSAPASAGYDYFKPLFPFSFANNKVIPFITDIQTVYFQNPQERTVNISPDANSAVNFPLEYFSGLGCIPELDQYGTYPSYARIQFKSSNANDSIDIVGKMISDEIDGGDLSDIAIWNTERMRLYSHYQTQEFRVSNSGLTAYNFTGSNIASCDIVYRVISYRNPYYY